MKAMSTNLRASKEAFREQPPVSPLPCAGTVRQIDVASQPPYSCAVRGESANKLTSYNYVPRAPSAGGSATRGRSTTFSDRARSGFKYWYRDKPAMARECFRVAAKTFSTNHEPNDRRTQ